MRLWSSGVLVSILVVSPSLACTIGDPSQQPVITITNSASSCSSGDDWSIGGTVTNVDTTQVQLTFYAYTNQWYVQPYIATPWTQIMCDGTFFMPYTHCGNEYAAIIVRRGYYPGDIIQSLPYADGTNVLAVMPFAATPVLPTSWGAIKTLYR